MKKWILLAWACVSCMALQAQLDSTIAFADYAFEHMDDTTQPHFLRTGDMRLLIGKRMSAYFDHGRMTSLRRMLSAPDINAELAADIKKDLTRGSIFKDWDQNLLTYVAPAGLNAYILEEPVPAIQWEVMQETRDINGYRCQKATCYFRGRNYEAWFCPQIPYSNGPWKLGGLPGLILEAYDMHRDVVFKFVAFGTGSGDAADTVFAVPKGITKTTAKAYHEYIDAMNKDTKAMLGAARASGGKLLMGAPAEGSGKRQKVLNNPLEKTNP